MKKLLFFLLLFVFMYDAIAHFEPSTFCFKDDCWTAIPAEKDRIHKGFEELHSIKYLKSTKEPLTGLLEHFAEDYTNIGKYIDGILIEIYETGYDKTQEIIKNGTKTIYTENDVYDFVLEKETNKPFTGTLQYPSWFEWGTILLDSYKDGLMVARDFFVASSESNELLSGPDFIRRIIR